MHEIITHVVVLATSAAATSATSNTDLIAWIVGPLLIFLLSSAAGGITMLVKFTGYMARSQSALEATAKNTASTDSKLTAYMQKTDSTLLNHTTKLAVHDSELEILQRAQSNGRRGYGEENR